MNWMDEPVGPKTDVRKLEPQGGASDFEAFFQAEHARLLRALYVITVNVSEAEELMQEAFVRVWERWDRVGRLDDPLGYLYRTAINRFRSGLRQAAVKARRLVSASAVHEPSSLGAAEARALLEPALKALSPRQRQALVLTELLGYPSNEAGRLMGVKATTVRVLAMNARASLRSAIEGWDE